MVETSDFAEIDELEVAQLGRQRSWSDWVGMLTFLAL